MSVEGGPTLGCIADDFTGATDLASGLAADGVAVRVVFDAAAITSRELAAVDAVVMAGKTRTASPGLAVTWSLEALSTLQSAGCSRYYFKYCSTFDSTPQGNIGPVIDGLLTRLGLRHAIAVPSYPANRRTVYKGLAFVGDLLLSESPMRHHPLTPMLDSDLARWLRSQTHAEVSNIFLEEVRAGTAALRRSMSRPVEGTSIAVVDAIDDADIAAIADAVPPECLPTGGAALGARLLTKPRRAAPPWMPTAGSRRLILSGSASQATRDQVRYAESRIPCRRIDLQRLGDNAYPQELAAWVSRAWDSAPTVPVAIYATGSAEDLASSDHRSRVADQLELLLAQTAALLRERGLDQLLVAGGETAGRVVAALGIASVAIGPSIAPGVPWTSGVAADGRPITLALKSGNFGEPNLFCKAWEVLS